jgi:hypothetical protein
MPYWLDWIKRDSKFPLPTEVSKALMSEAEAADGLVSGADPVGLGIEKWDRIAKAVDSISSQPLPLSYLHSLAKYIGYKTCALCMDSKSRYESTKGKIRYGTDKCQVCPLAAIDQCTQKGSTYDRIEELILLPSLEVPHETEIDRMMQLSDLCKAMKANLERLKKP